MSIIRDLLEASAPAWSTPPSEESVGQDYLGTLQVNLDMLSELTEGMNNVVTSSRQHALMVWAGWRFRENLRAVGKTDPTQQDWRDFYDAVESIQLFGHAELMAELGRKTVGLGEGVKTALCAGDPIPLRFSEYGRTHQTSIMAAVNYGPSSRTLGLLVGEGGIYLPTTQRGQPIAAVIDRLLLRAGPAYERLCRYPTPAHISHADAAALVRAGLAESPLQAERPERPLYLDALLDLDVPDNYEPRGRRLSLALILTLIGVYEEGALVDDLRCMMLSGCDSLGLPLQIPEHLQTTAQRWQILQIRQLQRYLLDVFLFWTETLLPRCPRVSDLVDVIRSAEVPAVEMTLREGLAALRAGCDDNIAAWAGRADVGTPFDLMREQLWKLSRKRPLDPAELIGPMVQLLLSVLVLGEEMIPESGALREFAALGGRWRLSLTAHQRWWRYRIDRPILSSLSEFLSELVLQQHVAVAVSRFDNDKRRLRLCNDELGWSLLPGTRPRRPRPTPDRLDALTALLADLDLITSGEEGWVLTGEGSRILERVAERY